MGLFLVFWAQPTSAGNDKLACLIKGSSFEYLLYHQNARFAFYSSAGAGLWLKWDHLLIWIGKLQQSKLERYSSFLSILKSLITKISSFFSLFEWKDCIKHRRVSFAGNGAIFLSIADSSCCMKAPVRFLSFLPLHLKVTWKFEKFGYHRHRYFGPRGLQMCEATT